MLSGIWRDLGRLIKGDKEYIDNFRGKNDTFNSLGNYDECMKNSETDYFLVKIQGSFTPVLIGMCAPKDC